MDDIRWKQRLANYRRACTNLESAVALARTRPLTDLEQQGLIETARSLAEGNFRPGSDVDLCLDAPDLDFSGQTRLEDRFDDLMLPWKFDITIRQQIDNPALLDHIDRVGIPLLTR